MNTAELRSLFLDYFAEHKHRVVPSSPLVPGNDPTLLFTNAGMVQFKDVFLGNDQRDYVRAASAQRCVRAGGKHNDLENVGYTARHHTFFEMLGNFSFGDYFKREAIQYAWEFITRRLGIPAELLWVTVFHDDDEAADIWLNEIGIDPARFSRLGENDNFWSMGDTGPCGPCSEIFYDHGEDVAGGPPGSANDEGDRYIEIWNLVFMQFDRDVNGTLHPLPKPSVDTGMGLERLAAVMQGVHSNYEIDLFAGLIRDIAAVTGATDLESSSLRVIADHIRACAFLIVDGVLPGNEGRGYVLRRIIRRALRHGYELGVTEPFFYRLVASLEREMGDAYPELVAAGKHVGKVLLNEEQRFAETLSHGMGLLETALNDCGDACLDGGVIFKLYDTYGFPIDLTADVARARNIEIDRDGFEAAMQAQKDRARAAQRFNLSRDTGVKTDLKSEFTGYDKLVDSSRVTGIIREGERVERIGTGEAGALVLERTPFYAESGGQVGDQGVVTGPDGFCFRVTDTRKSGSAHLHIGSVEAGTLESGMSVDAEADSGTRVATELHHSATHLLHAALREILGAHVSQKGSLVAADRLRFDFSHYEPVTPQQLQQIEALVNDRIRDNAEVTTTLMPYDQALEAGAMALFGEKYADEVRVLRISSFSTELCGGTHVGRAGDIGLFKIVSETGIASGVRRIEAVAGSLALEHIGEVERVLGRVAGLLKVGSTELETKLGHLLERSRVLERENEQLMARLADGAGRDATDDTIEIEGVQVFVNRLDDGVGPKVLREAVDRLKDRLGSAVVVLGSATEDGKVRLAAGVTKDVMDRVRAGDLVNSVALQVGGKGGGRADFAQAGGSDAAALNAALASVPDWIQQQLG
ncbi:MAG TPA: alanine--tRNA ligase [Gammaproteobacteria bacterium]|jgi:alanyl-tRNA synthetase|nr:alanine--tRNA ligase [Gammaproteobacteria bacterium]